MPPAEQLWELPRVDATMSSTAKSKFRAINCIDGSHASGNPCNSGCNRTDPLLEVDLGATYDTDFVVVHNVAGKKALYLGQFELWLGAEAGVRTQRCATAAVPARWQDAQGAHGIACAGAGARFVTLVLPGEGRCLSLVELRVLSRHEQAGASVSMQSVGALAEGSEERTLDTPSTIAAAAVPAAVQHTAAPPAAWNLTVLEALAGFAVLAVWTAVLCCYFRCTRARAARRADAKALPPSSPPEVEVALPPPPPFKKRPSSGGVKSIYSSGRSAIAEMMGSGREPEPEEVRLRLSEEPVPEERC